MANGVINSNIHSIVVSNSSAITLLKGAAIAGWYANNIPSGYYPVSVYVSKCIDSDGTNRDGFVGAYLTRGLVVPINFSNALDLTFNVGGLEFTILYAKK